MGKLIASINITTDGFCNHTDVVADEEFHQFAIDLLKSTGSVLLGRVTYQLFESYWPLAAKDTTLPQSILEFAHLIDNANKIVVSKTLTHTTWKNTSILNHIDYNIINNLKQRSAKDILVFGSPSIIAILSNLELIDEYYFSIQPILAGNGKRLFEDDHLSKKYALKHMETRNFSSGVVTLCYRRIKEGTE